MSKRWLSGVLLFALGFGSAALVQLPSIHAAAKEVVIEGNLKYVDGNELQLIYPKPNKNDNYLAIVPRKKKSDRSSGPQISFQTGKASFSKEDKEGMIIYRLTPVVIVKNNVTKPCNDPAVLCPLPPEPLPPPTFRQPSTQIAESFSYQFVKPENLPGSLPGRPAGRSGPPQ